ncbi:MAG: bifunctional serine/threonine-protein kinase/formylglycine-generating enzyme family protein [Pyrinomonadaceae bacterium]
MRECPACKLCFPDNINNCPIDGDVTFHSITGEPILEGKYQLEKRLGQGGMGVVYKARHNFLKTAHAIKVILPDLVGNDPNLVTRFRQEAIAAAAIRHRNIVSVSDFGVVAGKMPFLVMEYVQGETLHDLLVREKRLSPQLALEILSSICSGLAAAHRQDIVHRDLKPLNVIIQSGAPLDEAVKILDFGLAKIKSGELLGSFIQAQTTGLMGSPFYMAPEQWSDDEPDVRADVYSLGVMLYQMLAGDVPFKGSSIPAIMKKHLTDAPPSFTQIGLDVTPEIEAVVVHALEKDLTKRTQSVELLVNELRQAVGASYSEQNISSANLMADTLGAKNSKSATNLSVPQKTVDVAPSFTTLQVLTNPPQSKVFLDGKPLGTSEANGWLVAEKISRGAHRLKVMSDGFAESESEIHCEDEVFQTIVQLRSLLATNVAGTTKQGFVSAKNNQPTNAPDTMVNLAPTDVNSKIALNADSAAPVEAQNVGIRSYPEPQFEKTNLGAKQNTLRSGASTTTFDHPPVVKPVKSSFLLPIAIGVGALFLVFAVGIGIVIIKFYPINPPDDTNLVKPSPAPSTQPGVSPTPIQGVTPFKPEMVKIEGGTFQMGRNDGQKEARPAHLVTVKGFIMDKTEVTNSEYAQFISETNHRVPEDWKGNQPPTGILNMPVVNVSLDDAKEFAKWRSKRDKIECRLPTEEEWEYAARNGKDNTTYPWGNKFSLAENRAVVETSGLARVGSMPNGANKWGVQDLIGNVWEWTDSPLRPYTGSEGAVVGTVTEYIIRGGGNGLKIKGDKLLYVPRKSEEGQNFDSAFRQWVKPEMTFYGLGFRLVSDIKN